MRTLLKTVIASLLAVLLLCVDASAQQAAAPNEARQVFDKVYDKVFGPQGSTLRYDVNIIGLYKTHGTIIYKGKKQRFSDERVDTWNDGKTAFMVYRKKKTVEIHDANSDKKDKYSGKFKFSLDDFDYSMEHDGSDLVLILKRHKKAKGTIKEVRAWVDAETLVPSYVKIKVSFIWAKIRISEFKSGGISDAMFVFPIDNYREGYRFFDKRDKGNGK